eukprot:3350168-Rhodomonas_salina.2
MLIFTRKRAVMISFRANCSHCHGERCARVSSAAVTPLLAIVEYPGTRGEIPTRRGNFRAFELGLGHGVYTPRKAHLKPRN